MITSEYISKRCGAVTVQLTGSSMPQTPLLSPITREVTGYRQTKSNSTRPLMYPEEVLQMDNKQCLVLIRGQKPLKGEKIIPDELAGYAELKYTRVAEYVPAWREMDEAANTAKEMEVKIEAENAELSVASVPKIRVGGEEQIYDANEYIETDVQDIIDE